MEPRPYFRGKLHLLGALVSLFTCPYICLNTKKQIEFIFVCFFTFTIISQQFTSAVYHMLDWTIEKKQFMRRLDHSMIFLNIAGSHCAIAAVSLNGTTRITFLIIQLVGGLIGVCFRLFWFNTPRWIQLTTYLTVGWSPMLYNDSLCIGMGPVSFAHYIYCGIAFGIGGLVYVIKWPNPWPKIFGFHEIFHACSLIGVAYHQLAVLGTLKRFPNH